MGDDAHQWQTVQGRRKKGSQKKSDIATSTSSHNEHPDDITTYFFTSFPNSFGALAMLRAFKYYGNVTEVVIPTKRDAGGRRFGFARFARVTDIRGFELELDNIIIGRDKISVNLARFQRVEGERRFDRNQVRKEGRRSRRDEEQHDKAANERSLVGTLLFPCKEEPRSFAHAVKTGKLSHQTGAQSIVLSYEAAKEDMEKLQKAFVGVVHEPGTTYNIQSAFHRQGYFGVKVTPLGANLALLEGQEDGEVEALMEDAKGWLDQWFKEIRSWCPSDLDVERTVWLRICGVPSHAWNEVFFAQLVKPWGSFINEDECTLKKSTMDVARLMIRTSCQQIIDEFIDVKVNGDVYHLRVLEDSYGPMRIMIPQNNGNEGRDSSVESEDEEEEVRGMWTEGDLEDRESEVGELLALKSASNANIVQVNISDPNLGSNNDKEEGKENSICVEGVRSKEDSRLVNGGILLGQEDGAEGPQYTSNTNLSITGGVVRKETQSAEVGCLQHSLLSEGGGEGHRTRGVYSDGPRNVYLKLTKAGAIGNQDTKGKDMTRIHPTPVMAFSQVHESVVK